MIDDKVGKFIWFIFFKKFGFWFIVGVVVWSVEKIYVLMLLVVVKF